MLETHVIEQLREVFSKLEDAVSLHVHPSEHADQADLLELLNGIAQASSLISVQIVGEPSAAPSFQIYRESRFSGIAFRGIPTGHEFTSLVLAILYSDGKGKQPDSGVLARVTRLKGPIRLRTFISLTCENCPEIVQALSLMATHHPDFHHEMIDGAIAQEEIEALQVKGVPAVYVGRQLLHSGKSNFLELLTKLEAHFGSQAPSEGAELARDLGQFEVAVVGAGPAGVSAAIYSARKGLKTVLISERFGGQLQETKGIENMISVPYTEGVRLSAELGKHLSAYPVTNLEHRRVQSIAGDHFKELQFESGETLRADTVIIATGAKWKMLGVPGEREHIGMGVAFCAHCDGPFYKDKRVAVVGGGNSGVEAALDLAAIATHVTLFEYNDHLKADEVLVQKVMHTANITVKVSTKTTRVIGDGSRVSGLEYQDRATQAVEQVTVDGVFVQIGLSPNTQFLQGLVDLTPFGEIVVDAKGRTSIPGIYAAGDVTTLPFKQIVMAMGDGAKVALTAFEDRMRREAAPVIATSA